MILKNSGLFLVFIFFQLVYTKEVNIRKSVIPNNKNITRTQVPAKNTTAAVAEPIVNAAAAPIATAVSAVTTAPLAAPVTTTRKPLLQGLRLPCACHAGQCGCCTGYILDRFSQKGCVNITYEPDDFALTAQMTMNGKVLYKNSISGKNPAPICIRVPRLQFIKFCVQFSNIYVAQRNIHVCIDAEANWQDFTLLEWSFDCVKMGASGVSVISPTDGGGVPGGSIDSEEQTDEDYDDSARNNVKNATEGNTCENQIILDSSFVKNNKRTFDSKKVVVRKLNNCKILVSYR